MVGPLCDDPAFRSGAFQRSLNVGRVDASPVVRVEEWGVGEDAPFVFEVVAPFAVFEAAAVAWGGVAVLATVEAPDFVVAAGWASGFFAECALPVFADGPEGDELVEPPDLLCEVLEGACWGFWLAGGGVEEEACLVDASPVGARFGEVEAGELVGGAPDVGWECDEFVVLGLFGAGVEGVAFDDAGAGVAAGGGAGGCAGEAGEHVGDGVDGSVPVVAGVLEGVGEFGEVVSPVLGVAFHGVGSSRSSSGLVSHSSGWGGGVRLLGMRQERRMLRSAKCRRSVGFQRGVLIGLRG